MKTERQKPRDSQNELTIPPKSGFADQKLQILARQGNKAKTCDKPQTSFDSDVSVCR